MHHRPGEHQPGERLQGGGHVLRGGLRARGVLPGVDGGDAPGHELHHLGVEFVGGLLAEPGLHRLVPAGVVQPPGLPQQGDLLGQREVPGGVRHAASPAGTAPARTSSASARSGRPLPRGEFDEHQEYVAGAAVLDQQLGQVGAFGQRVTGRADADDRTAEVPACRDEAEDGTGHGLVEEQRRGLAPGVDRAHDRGLGGHVTELRHQDDRGPLGPLRRRGRLTVVEGQTAVGDVGDDRGERRGGEPREIGGLFVFVGGPARPRQYGQGSGLRGRRRCRCRHAALTTSAVLAPPKAALRLSTCRASRFLGESRTRSSRQSGSGPR